MFLGAQKDLKVEWIGGLWLDRDLVDLLINANAMMVLVVVPCLKPNYEAGFSAPLSWLFSRHIGKVLGVYSSELTEELIRSHETFIVELNWFTELYEFSLIIKTIKRYNNKAKILFGGLFSSIMYREIFRHHDVDYYILGDNELPIRMFLDGFQPQEIPNFIGRDFEVSTRYVFSAREFDDLEYNIDWFPGYLKRKAEASGKGDVGMYVLPMIITTKSGCSCVHEGCDYCMGSKDSVIEEIYGRPPLVMTSRNLHNALAKVSAQYSDYCVYINSDFVFDLKEGRYKGCAHIEVDCRVTLSDIRSLFECFDKCVLLIPLYSEGIMGGSIIGDYQDILELEDENHSVAFAAYTYDRDTLKDIPERNIVYNLDQAFAPGWAHWSSYSSYDIALKNSKKMYEYYIKNHRECFAIDSI